MSVQENEFAAKITQIAQYVLGIERRLNDLSQRFDNRPELQQLDLLQNTLAQVEERLNERSTVAKTPVETVKELSHVPNAGEEQSPLQQSFESQLIFDRTASRAILLEALSTTQQWLIIVCPWLSQNSIDADLLQRFRDCLDRNCYIDIGWGYLGDHGNIGLGWRYNALADLRQLEREYPEQFKLKLLGTHEKFLVCDRSFGFLGSHNLLASGIGSAEREVGIRTTNPQVIQGLLDRFDRTMMQELGEVDETQTVNFTNCDSYEANEVEAFSDQFDTNDENFDIELDADEITDAKSSQGEAIASEEFLRRYNLAERDFTGINLAGVDLSGKTLADDKLNLSKANLTRAKLGKTKLDCINLTGANLKNAQISEAQLHQTNLTEANLENADLRKANLYGTKLVKANLKNANLSEVNLSLQVDLNGAVLSGANLNKVNLRKAKTTGTDLSCANLNNANLLEANLESANLQKVKLYHALYNTATVFPIGFDPANVGAYLIAPDASLPGANLATSDLSGVNLTGANLSAANLRATNLSNTDLSEANLEKANLHQANLHCAKLLQANLEGANLSQVKLNSANLTAANLVSASLIQANLEAANLTAADLSQANLKNTNLYRANFSGAILTSVNLVGVTFQGNMSGADLTGANLCGANCSGANLSGANLASADLRGANLSQANLEKANLKEAKLGGANLTGAKLTGATMSDGNLHD